MCLSSVKICKRSEHQEISGSDILMSFEQVGPMYRNRDASLSLLGQCERQVHPLVESGVSVREQGGKRLLLGLCFAAHLPGVGYFHTL